MASESLKIKSSEAYQTYLGLKIPKSNKKNANFDTVADILQEFGVVIKPKPSDKELFRKWQLEKKRIISVLDRIIQNQNRKKSKHGKKTIGVPQGVDIGPKWSKSRNSISSERLIEKSWLTSQNDRKL